ncbi:MAG: hypothetical protein DMG85_15130 [Acidobacteria bacterium]|nr:MAG: hypothetical protein DMG85_15130 [Acidobacteriota bacterium]
MVDGIETVITNDDTIEIICDRSECEFALLVGVLAGDWRAMQLKLNQGSTRKVAPRNMRFPNYVAELLGPERACGDKKETAAGEDRFSTEAPHGNTAGDKRMGACLTDENKPLEKLV